MKVFRALAVKDTTTVVVATLVGVLTVVTGAQAATTISTNITTGGSINASSTLQITGAVTTWGTATFGDATADTQLFNGSLNASSTSLFTGAVTTWGTGTFGDAAADTQLFNGSLNASSTSLFTGAVTMYGDVTIGDAVSDSVTANAYFTQLRIGTGTTFDQIGTVGADELGVEGDAEIDGTLSIGTAASTTALRVGNDQATTINGIVFGFCSFADVTSFTASTTKFVHCTGATGLTTSHRVFVQATSSFDSPFIIQAASSTAANVISLRVLNTGLDGAADTTLGGTSVNFWAVR